MATTAPLPDNEQQRLEWLRQCGILDSLPETAFDEAVYLAAQMCRAPIAAVNLVDGHRQWSKAAVGQDKKEDSRAISFCAHTLLQPDLMIVPDALEDERFADNPLVTGDPYIRFYAGVPLITSEGFGLGSLCVVDRIPRRLSDEQTALLKLLASQLVVRIEMQRHIALQDGLMADRERLLGEVRSAAERQRVFLREVLSSVTGGRLRLVETMAGLPAVLPATVPPIPLTAAGGLSTLRRTVRERAQALGFADERWQDLMTAASEGGMNAIVHGGGRGMAVISNEGRGTLQVCVWDWGAGINMENLPQATLSRGWSSTASLGHGLVMMLQSVDRLWLMTGPGGTTVVLEQDREPPPPVWLQDISLAGG